MRSSTPPTPVLAGIATALVVVTVAGLAGCDRPIALAEGAIVQVSFDVPGDAVDTALPKTSTTFVTAEVVGLAAETRLVYDGKHASGSLGFAVKQSTKA